MMERVLILVILSPFFPGVGAVSADALDSMTYYQHLLLVFNSKTDHSENTMRSRRPLIPIRPSDLPSILTHLQ